MNKIKEIICSVFNLVTEEQHHELNEKRTAEIKELTNEVYSLQKANEEIYGDYLVLEEKTNQNKEHITNLIDNNSKLYEDNLTLIKELKKEELVFEPISERYRWDKGKEEYMHKSLYMTNEDVDYYINWLYKYNLMKKYDSMDDMVYKVVQVLYDYFYNTYQVDMRENWLLPREALETMIYNQTHSKKKEFDCEDMAVIIYSCLRLIAEYNKWDITDRLLRVDIIQLAPSKYGHAGVTYKKDNNMWVKLETSLHPKTFKDDWYKPFFDSVYIEIWHIFDRNTEYKLVNNNKEEN